MKTFVAFTFLPAIIGLAACAPAPAPALAPKYYEPYEPALPPRGGIHTTEDRLYVPPRDLTSNVFQALSDVNGDTKTKRGVQLTHMYTCADKDWAKCQNLECVRGACYNLGEDFYLKITSVGPDPGTTCSLYDAGDCTGRSLDGIVNPGITNLDLWGWNDKTKSYKCV